MGESLTCSPHSRKVLKKFTKKAETFCFAELASRALSGDCRGAFSKKLFFFDLFVACFCVLMGCQVPEKLALPHLPCSAIVLIHQETNAERH
jgi:hypothetical protein